MRFSDISSNELNSGMSARSQHVLNNIRDTRNRDRLDLGGQNDRLARYVEKIRLTISFLIKWSIFKCDSSRLKIEFCENISSCWELVQSSMQSTSKGVMRLKYWYIKDNELWWKIGWIIQSLRTLKSAEHEKRIDFQKNESELRRVLDDSEEL